MSDELKATIERAELAEARARLAKAQADLAEAQLTRKQALKAIENLDKPARKSASKS